MHNKMTKPLNKIKVKTENIKIKFNSKYFKKFLGHIWHIFPVPGLQCPEINMVQYIYDTI